MKTARSNQGAMLGCNSTRKQINSPNTLPKTDQTICPLFRYEEGWNNTKWTTKDEEIAKRLKFAKQWTAISIILLAIFMLYCGGWQLKKRCSGRENVGPVTQDCI